MVYRMMEATNNKLGKYILGEQIGEGKYGWVYKAADNLGRKLAIKVLKPGWADDALALERFRREAIITSQLFHNRIATIIDFDEDGGRRFIVMRYVDGVSLDKLIKQKNRLSWNENLEILGQVADGLDYAHKRGFIHRDVSLINIMVSKTEGAVITDFGLARVASMNMISSSGVVLGTPYYIAPEIWSGKAASPATDVYSLACAAYEMVTGKILFSGESTPEIMTRHMLYPPQFPEIWPEDVPPAFKDVLLKALEKDPSLRYQDVISFVNDLNILSIKTHRTEETSSVPAEIPDLEEKLIPETNIVDEKPIYEGNSANYKNPVVPLSETSQQKEKTGSQAASRSLFMRLWPFGVGAALLFLLGILLGGPASQALASTKIFQAALTQQAAIQNIFATRTPGNTTSPEKSTEIPSNTIQGIADGTRKSRVQDGMVMVIVPSGTFIMGTDPLIAMAYCRQINNDCQDNWFTDEEPVHKVNIETFWIDQTEVTTSQYNRCVQAGACAPPANKSSVSRPDYFGNNEFADFPVVNVDWNKAMTYCSWAGARLPTEAEWEKAARGTDGRSYPWGEGIDPTLANINSKDTSRVGSFLGGISPYGVYDMAGNVWEWTADWYDVYPGGKMSSSTDFGTIFRVVRGGSWYGSFNDSRSSNRDRGEITNAFSDLGFRCAVSSK